MILSIPSIVFLVLFFVCAVLAVVHAIKEERDPHRPPASIIFIGLCAGLVILVAGFLKPKYIKEPPKEYPASDYTLEYKITDFQGQRDTIYVLTPKND